MKDKIILKRIAIVAELSDGTMRQIILKTETEEIILNLIIQMEGTVKVLEEPIGNICFKIIP